MQTENPKNIHIHVHTDNAAHGAEQTTATAGSNDFMPILVALCLLFAFYQTQTKPAPERIIPQTEVVERP
jgi:hypothetical protein